MKNGRFTGRLGCYTLNKLPTAGLYEYIYKNDELLLKLDQYGVQLCQIDPPSGIALIKRERRESRSPACIYFAANGKVFNNFDVLAADKLSIEFCPEAATYSLTFGDVTVTTELFVPVRGRVFTMNVRIDNAADTPLELRIMPCVFPHVNELLMAPWDKPEWYTRTSYTRSDYPTFTTTRYSIAGKREERRYFSLVTDLNVKSHELSDERLTTATKNFTTIPVAFTGETANELYAFSQCFAAIAESTIPPHGAITVRNVFTTALHGESVSDNLSQATRLFDEQNKSNELQLQRKGLDDLFAVRTVKTADKAFDDFVNGFLPLELSWVCALDRGWPTGMRGVRDASNDFSGYIDYDKNACRNVIQNIFAKQRSDGWYPRQIPFGDGQKFDLREFVDSACFFTEFVYDYVAATDDYDVLHRQYGYYDNPELLQSGIEHLRKGVEFLLAPDSLGEHSLVKIRGGDWLDCLNAAGIKGRGESVMVTCQLVMSLRYLAELLGKLGENGASYLAAADKLADAVNAAAFNNEGFYNGVFTDNGEWIFSTHDPDGERRVYAPTNSYAVISGVARGKEQRVIENLESLKTEGGYRLFSVPFGIKTIDGIGKMGTGDFQPYFAENASVYNHGSQLFYARALACAGDYQKLYNVLMHALPYDEAIHAESCICAAPYAITNCYQLVPSFYGRTGFSFLTGSVAMIERAIYSWMFGISFSLDSVVIKPCIPLAFADATVTVNYGDTKITVTYSGYGNKVQSAAIDGTSLPVADGTLRIDKSALQGASTHRITVTVKG